MSTTANGRNGDAVVRIRGLTKSFDTNRVLNGVDLEVTRGEKVAPKEVELVLMNIPGVKEAAVIGVPDPKWSERPLACVVLESGAELSKQDVLDFLAPRVAKWQLPDDVVFIDEVPKTSVGKFSKRTLRDRFADYVLES